MNSEDKDELSNEVQIIYQYGRPYGIRNKGGYLLFFSTVDRYEGQDARYKKETALQEVLAKQLLQALQSKEINA